MLMERTSILLDVINELRLSESRTYELITKESAEEHLGRNGIQCSKLASQVMREQNIITSVISLKFVMQESSFFVNSSFVFHFFNYFLNRIIFPDTSSFIILKRTGQIN